VGIPTHLRCQQLVEIASDYLERTLDAPDMERLEQHLLICAACAEYIAQLRQIRERSAELRRASDAPETPTDATEQRLLGLLRKFKGEGDP
jgi:anti-sigma factor RsiW